MKKKTTIDKLAREKARHEKRMARKSREARERSCMKGRDKLEKVDKKVEVTPVETKVAE